MKSDFRITLNIYKQEDFVVVAKDEDTAIEFAKEIAVLLYGKEFELECEKAVELNTCNEIIKIGA